MKKSILLISFLNLLAICSMASNNGNSNSNTCLETKLEAPSQKAPYMSITKDLATELNVTNIEDIGKQANVKKSTWIPWFYIAAGASAVTGVYTYIKSNSLYNNYPLSTETNEAENFHSEVLLYDNITKIALGAATGFAAIGIIVHIKHVKKEKSISVSYIPVTDGAALGLTYKF